MILLFSGCSDAASIGIIGGADGPTAIYVSSSFNWWILVAVILVLAGAIGFWLYKRK